MPLQFAVGSEQRPLGAMEPLPFLPRALPALCALCNYSLASPDARLTA